MTAQIKKLMDTLHISEAEAIELEKADAEIDRMTVGEANADLTESQKAVAKQARNSDHKKMGTVKRERKPNDAKRHLMLMFKVLMEGNGCPVELTNAEREMTFEYEGVKYRLTLAQPRS